MGDEDQTEITELFLLHAGSSPTVDIIAVENVGEQYRRCWISESGDILWLKHEKFLPRKFPNSRIFSFGYKFGGESGPRTLAESLLQELTKARTDSEVPNNLPFTSMRV